MNITPEINNKSVLTHKYFKTKAGVIFVIFNNNKIIKTEFIKQELDDHNLNSADNLNQETTKCLINNINFSGTDFQIKVWKAAINIPEGTTLSYQEIANIIGQPKSYRAVANALGQNKIAYFIPCHRVVRKNGDIGGYKWGVEIKKALLDYEKAYSATNQVML